MAHHGFTRRRGWLSRATHPWAVAGAGLAGLAALTGLKFGSEARWALMKVGLARERTTADAVAEFGPRAEARFGPACRAAGIPWPPPRVRLLAFKEERRLEVWVAGEKGGFAMAGACPVLAASGGPGPKRKQGDLQVPEGFYRLTALNPNSKFHLSVRVDYPNREDVANRIVDPDLLGTDIYVHGGAASIGCLAVGDRAIEELFALLAQVREGRREIWILPRDLRVREASPPKGDSWVEDLYLRLEQRAKREHAAAAR
jgi:hypothetical protein